MFTPSSGSITSFSASSTWSKSAGANATAMELAYFRLGEIAIVALVFKGIRQLGTTTLGDAAVDEDVHEVGLDVAQDARVVGDEQHAEIGVRLRAVHALRHDLESIDVEAGVGLVEDREARLQHLELQDLVALLLTTGESLVHAAVCEGRVHPQVLHRLFDLLHPTADGRRLAVEGGLGGAEEVRHGDAGDLHRVLHREEEAGARARVDGE